MFDDSAKVFLVFITSLVMVSAIVLFYLKTSVERKSYYNEKLNSLLKGFTETYEFKLKELQKRVSEIVTKKYTPEDVNYITNELKKDITTSVLTETIIEDMEKSINPKIDQKLNEINHDILSLKEGMIINQNIIIEETQLVQDGIEIEINNLRKRANINLVIGIFITFCVMVILINTISLVGIDLQSQVTSTVNPIDTKKMIWSFFIILIPRLSFALFMQLFALFFLKLYKSSLQDIKFFRNEWTNIQLKLLALKSAMNMKKDDTLHSVIKMLSQTERNFLIPKGYSSQHAELEKISKEEHTDFIKQLKDILKNFKENK